MKALITGASSGIGKEIARYLAELGYDLILVSRSTDKLNKLKEELSNVNVRVITLDFSRESDSLDLYEHIKNENEQITCTDNGSAFQLHYWQCFRCSPWLFTCSGSRGHELYRHRDRR